MGLGVLLTALGATQVAADRRAPAQPLQQLPVAVVESVLSQTPTVSADGRWVVYAGVREVTAAADPASADQSAQKVQQDTIWLKDRENDVVVDLTPSSTSLRVGRTVWPVISADGCTLTVITELALDLFRDDDIGNRWDVYRLLLPHCNGEPGARVLMSRLATMSVRCIRRLSLPMATALPIRTSSIRNWPTCWA